MKKFKSRCLQAVLMTLSLFAVCNSANAADNLVEVADKAGTFQTLLTAAKAAGLAHTLQEEGPFTVFAPTDDAFAKLPKHTLDDLLNPENKEKLATILKYHVLAGKVTAKNAVQVESANTLSGESVTISIRDGRLTVNDATVILNDVEASNGIIHVIDSVLMPPKPKNIVETAAATGNFKTLLAAVEAAGLVETLQGHGPFTVFAPSDKAFTKLGKETLASLLKPENKDKLQAILKYHVVPGRLSVDDIEHLKVIKTAQGAEVRVKVDPFADPGPGLAINQSNVISGDIDAANGIIHVIDSVLMPPADVKTGHRKTSHLSPASSSTASGAELLEIQKQDKDLIHIRELDCFFAGCWKYRVYIPQNRGTTLRLSSGIFEGSQFSTDHLTRNDSVEIPPHIDGGEFDISITIRPTAEGKHACYIFVADPGKRTFWKSVSMPPLSDLKILTSAWEKFAQSSKRVMRTKTFHKEVMMYRFGEPIPVVVLNKGERDEFEASDITAQSTPAVWLTFPGPQ